MVRRDFSAPLLNDMSEIADMSEIVEVRIKRNTEDSYTVTLFQGTVKNELGAMREMALFAYLKNRPLIDDTPEHIVDSLKVGEEAVVHFQQGHGV
jgi:hypothetical protein